MFEDRLRKLYLQFLENLSLVGKDTIEKTRVKVREARSRGVRESSLMIRPKVRNPVSRVRMLITHW